MYLRATARRTKSGELVRYLQLAHNERNERGVPVARVIHNFGREDRLDREALVRLVASIQRFLGGEETLRARTPEGFEFVRAPESGGPHVVDSLWSQPGIGRARNGSNFAPARTRITMPVTLSTWRSRSSAVTQPSLNRAASGTTKVPCTTVSTMPIPAELSKKQASGLITALKGAAQSASA